MGDAGGGNNSIELTKLSLLGGTAITQLAGAPAAGASQKSKICTTVPNIVCDSVQSFDEPNNYGYPALTDDSPDWERSVAYWASRPRQWKNGTVTQDACVLAPTDFILADSEEKADRLYSKIFQYPDSCVSPRGMGLDDPSNPWTTDGPATVSTDPTTKTQGNGSLEVSGCGYTVIKSPTFNSTDFGLVSSSLALDVYIPAEQANQYWWGDVKMFASIPAAGVNNAYLGLVGFTGLPSNQWTTITFSVPDAVKTALLGDYRSSLPARRLAPLTPLASTSGFQRANRATRQRRGCTPTCRARRRISTTNIWVTRAGSVHRSDSCFPGRSKHVWRRHEQDARRPVCRTRNLDTPHQGRHGSPCQRRRGRDETRRHRPEDRTQRPPHPKEQRLGARRQLSWRHRELLVRYWLARTGPRQPFKLT